MRPLRSGRRPIRAVPATPASGGLAFNHIDFRPIGKPLEMPAPFNARIRVHEYGGGS